MVTLEGNVYDNPVTQGKKDATIKYLIDIQPIIRWYE